MTTTIVAPLLRGNTLGSRTASFVIAEWRDPGGSVSERRLVDRRMSITATMKRGTCSKGRSSVQVGDKEVDARAGSGVLVPRGTPHAYWNPGPGPTRYLLTMTSNIYQLIQEIHAMKHSGRSGSAILEA